MLFLQLLLRWVHTLLQRSFRPWRARLLGRVMLQICCIWRHSVPLDRRHDDEQAWLNAIVCTISLSPANFSPVQVLDYEDLASDWCFAIRILGNKSGTRRPMCVLWIGSDFSEGEDAAVEAFDDVLRTSPFFIPPLVICREGEEPEELMGLF